MTENENGWTRLLDIRDTSLEFESQIKMLKAKFLCLFIHVYSRYHIQYTHVVCMHGENGCVWNIKRCGLISLPTRCFELWLNLSFEIHLEPFKILIYFRVHTCMLMVFCCFIQSFSNFRLEPLHNAFALSPFSFSSSPSFT